jgi:hypothetical protein
MPSAKTTDPSSGLSPETELLLCCARTEVDDETAARIQDLADERLDWGALLQRADDHMVLPLLYRTLKTVAPNAAPTVAQEQLRAGFHSCVRNNLLLAHQLLDLIERFDAHDVPVVPFKGPVAAASVYDDLHLRPFGDLDLLVHLPDVPKAQHLLREGQFDDWEKLPPLSALDFDRPPSWYSALAEPFSKSKNFVRTSGHRQTVVELHWELIPPYFRHPLDPDSFWERLRAVSLMDTQVRTFASEDTLLYFCLHGTFHHWSQLRLVCDVAELLRRGPEVKWDELLERAGALNSRRLLLLGLRLAHRLLGAPLPPRIRRHIRSDSTVASLARRCWRRLFRSQGRLASAWDTYMYNVQVRDRLTDGVGLCVTNTWAALPHYLDGLSRGNVQETR